MRIGLIKETKDQERRVALTPAGVGELHSAGHEIVVELGAGAGVGISDATYEQAGAHIVTTEQAWDSELVIKVKEPQAGELVYFNGQILFAFLHLAGVAATLTKALIKGKVSAIAYELIADTDGRYPLLAPMSAIAGNMATSVGAWYLAASQGGKGMQLGTVLGQHHGRVMVIGDGVVGQHAARSAAGLGAEVLLFGRDATKSERLRSEFATGLSYVESTPDAIRAHIGNADLVIGAVLLPGDRTPRIVSREMVASMQAGSVIVDVSIDQGGCIETSRATSHSNPVYREADVIHYAVTNMPGAYPLTATHALTTASLPYIHRLADHGLTGCRQDRRFTRAMNTHRGFITSETIATALDLPSLYRDFAELET